MELGRISSALNPGVVETAATEAVRTPEQVSQERDLIKAVKALNGSELFGHDRELTFVFDRESRKALVRVVNRETREVVMQIPPESVMRMAREHNRR